MATRAGRGVSLVDGDIDRVNEGAGHAQEGHQIATMIDPRRRWSSSRQQWRGPPPPRPKYHGIVAASCIS